MGSGSTRNNDNAGQNYSNEMAGGLGFRYLLARRLGMRVGADIARGPEDTVFYLSVGSAWQY